MTKNSIGKDQPSLDDLISLKEAAKMSGLSQAHLRRLAGQGELKAQKVGRDWVTTERAVREYLARNRRPGPSKKS
jgi:excisionase family DNA binding protein